MTVVDEDFLDDVVHKALKAGADAADALLVNASDVSVTVRGGALERLERSESGDLGLRVFIGRKQAVVSSSDRSAKARDELIDRAVTMARAALEDPFCGLASPDEIAREYPALDLADKTEFSVERLSALAQEAEDAARAVSGVSSVESSDAGYRTGRTMLVASNGFKGSTERTGYVLSVIALAGEGTGMQRDYDAASRVFAADLPAPGVLGKSAGERVVRRLNPRKMPTARVPVFFDPRISGNLVGAFLGAITGSAIARGTSFLKDSLGKQVFSEAITMIDDPHRARGLRSRAFDAEGIAPKPRKLIDRGALTTWLLDSRSARQLGLHSTGHAARSTGGTPSPRPTNVFMAAGNLSPEALMRDVVRGFYVTDTMGMGVNGVTGDMSLAAAGFWIENGQKTFAVNEMTIAGNLKDMFLNMTAASDLFFEYGVDAPTLRVDGMTIAGT
jgi:PmbA protein